MAASEQGRQQWIMEGPIGPCATDIAVMINNSEMSDIKFQVGPNRETIYGHKVILFARCNVLKKKCQAATSTESSTVVSLPDITPETFKSILQFIYTNRITLTESAQAIDVLKNSIVYELEELRKLCNEYLTKNMDVTTASEIMQAAVTWKQQDLKETALEFIEQNTERVFRNNKFHIWSEEALCEILQSVDLNIDESDIIEAVKEWAEMHDHAVIDGKEKVEIAKAVVQHIRLPLLSPEELTELRAENKKDRVIGEELFTDAFSIYHFKQANEAQSFLITPRKGTKVREHHKSFTHPSKYTTD